ncbi:MAG: AtpZ/AtpI family protein [Proteobacteria bacterium]|nr:AtpZ/AtpI family protein [Pseudomonadota bacterium]
MKNFNRGKNFRKYLQLSSIGIEMGVATMIGLGIGWSLDKYIFREKYYPWLTLIFLFFGFIAGIKNALQLIKSLDKKEEDE